MLFCPQQPCLFTPCLKTITFERCQCHIDVRSLLNLLGFLFDGFRIDLMAWPASIEQMSEEILSS